MLRPQWNILGILPTLHESKILIILTTISNLCGTAIHNTKYCILHHTSYKHCLIQMYITFYLNAICICRQQLYLPSVFLQLTQQCIQTHFFFKFFSSIIHILLLNVHPTNLANPSTVEQLVTSYTLLEYGNQRKYYMHQNYLWRPVDAILTTHTHIYIYVW
jgi:hypothetical protein